MSDLQKQDQELANALILNGDLSKLASNQKLAYYNGYCTRLGLDPFTKPFELLKLNGKEVLYLTRAGAQQLNKLHKLSHSITSRELIEAAGIYQVTARAQEFTGRYTESIGAVNITGLKGDNYANAIMKAETKAKRRATLDLLGLGILDETEVETIAKAETKSIESETTEAKIVNEEDEVKILHEEFMVIWNEFKDSQGTEIATPFHPSRWKEAQRKSVKSYQGAIKTLTEKLETLKESI